MLNTTQVSEQKQRFQSFMASVNLTKVGARYFYFMFNDAEDGRYTPYCYILRVLRLLAKVGGCYYCPGTNDFYNKLLERAAIDSYLKRLPPAVK